LRVDSEATFQFGTFAYRPIRAWAVTTNSGYTISSRKGQEIDYRLGFDGGIASGNHNPTKGSFGIRMREERLRSGHKIGGNCIINE
jgi:hypothetical protein